MVELEQKTGSKTVALFDELQKKGNVQDLYNRPHVENENGSYSTLLTTTLDSRNFETEIPWVLNITAVDHDGNILSDEAINDYVQGLIDKTNGSIEEILAADKSEQALILEIESAESKD